MLILFIVFVSEVISGFFRDKLINILLVGLLIIKLNFIKFLVELRYIKMGVFYIYFFYFCFFVKIIVFDWKLVVILFNVDIFDLVIFELYR